MADLLAKLPECPDPKCVRKAHGPGQGVHVGEGRDEQGRAVVWPVEDEEAPADEPPDLTIRDVASTDDLKALVRTLRASDVICFDVETASDREASEDWHPHSRVVSASFSVEPGEAWVVPLSHPEFAKRFPYSEWRKWLKILVIASKHARLVGHNLKYDVRWAYSMTGVDLNERQWFDTMAAAHLLDENAPKDLKTLGHEYLGMEKWKDVDLKRAEAEPWDRLALYNARDTDATLRLARLFRDALAESPSLARLFHFLLMPVSRALVYVERNGLTLDVPALQDHQARLTAALADIRESMWNTWVPEHLQDKFSDPTVRHWLDEQGEYHVAIPGLMPTWSPQGKFFHALMEELEVPVLERSPKTGKPSWAAGVMKRLALEGDYGFVKDHLEMRHIEKELTAFVTPWLEMRSPHGRLHPTFKPANVTTGRLSAADPNPQQISKGLKRFIVAPDGWLVAQADYSQIEMRVAAEIANAYSMIEAFQRGDDLHKITAASITGKTPDTVTPAERQKGKVAGFGFLYGMGAGAFKDYAFEQYDVAFTFEEAQATRRAFFDTWPEIEKWHERQRRLVRTDGEVRSPLGRRRRLPDIWEDDGYLAAMAERQAINAPVQSMASDLMLLAIVEMSRTLSPRDAQIVCTVHDSVVLYVRKGALRRVAGQVARAMLYPPIERMFGARPLRVPLEVEFEVGPAWGKSEKTFAVRS